MVKRIKSRSAHLVGVGFLWCSGVTESTGRIGVVVRRKLVLNAHLDLDVCVCCVCLLSFPRGWILSSWGWERRNPFWMTCAGGWSGCGGVCGGDGAMGWGGVGWYNAQRDTNANTQSKTADVTRWSPLVSFFFSFVGRQASDVRSQQKAKRRQQRPRPKLQKLQAPVVVKSDRSKGGGQGRWVWISCCLFVRSWWVAMRAGRGWMDGGKKLFSICSGKKGWI